jgi:hypothetical protein
VFGLLGLSVLIATIRYHTFSAPVETNVAVHYYMGHELLQGRRLYTDCFDHQPPAVAVTFAGAEAVAGYGHRAIYFACVVAGIVTLFGVYGAGSVAGGFGFGLWAGLFWAIVSSDGLLYLFLGETEVFINATLATAFAVLVRAQKRLGTGGCILTGLLFALGTFYKHSVVIPVAALSVFHVLAPPEESNRARAARDVLVWLAIGVMAWGLSLVYFAAAGRLEDYWDALFRFNYAYAQQQWTGGWFHVVEAKLAALVVPPVAVRFVWPLLLLTVAVLGSRSAVETRRKLLLLGWALGLAGMILCSEALDYHYAIWLPPLAVGAAWGLATVERWTGARRFLAMPALAIGTATLLLVHEVGFLKIPGDDWTDIHLLMKEYGEARDLAKELDGMLASNETFFVWGDEPSLYIYTRREAPTPYFWLQGYLRGPMTNKVTARVLANLETQKPPLAVICEWRSQSETNHPVFRYLSTQYAALTTTNVSSFGLRVRKDSSLFVQMSRAGRVAPSPASKTDR